jgi:hypothetical protein
MAGRFVLEPNSYVAVERRDHEKIPEALPCP